MVKSRPQDSDAVYVKWSRERAPCSLFVVYVLLNLQPKVSVLIILMMYVSSDASFEELINDN